MDVKEHLERLTPETERLPYWDNVLRDARPSRLRWAAPRVAVVAFALAFAAVIAVAPWREAERTGILDRALAAVGDGPVTHLVIRTQWGGTLVDLDSGKHTPLYHEVELWQDPERGIVRIERLGGQLQGSSVAARQDVEKPLGLLTSYREALESGEARVLGEGAIEGVDVVWVEVERGMQADAVWRVEVAVRRDRFTPMLMRETVDGRPVPMTNVRVLVAEQLPAGTGDFARAPQKAQEPVSFGISRDTISRERALELTDGRAAWLGPEFRGLPLAKIGRLAIRTDADEVVGIHLTYGSLTELNEPDGSKSFITIEQAPRRHPALERGIGPYDVPTGHVALTPGGNAYLDYRGTYVVIRARAGDVTALEAAQALRALSE
jgi:hypothetical protein